MERLVKGADLQAGMKIVGTRGGHSEIVSFGDIFGFLIAVNTEHGVRQIDLDDSIKVWTD